MPYNTYYLKYKTTITAAWWELFLLNERSKKKFTDQQLREIMIRAFPGKAESSTIQRVSWMRHQYNSGTGMFKSRGRGLVRSHQWSAGGEKLTD